MLRCLVAIVLLAGAPALAAGAQSLDTLMARPVVGVAFEEARSLAADPLGRLYIADAGADVVWRLAVGGVLDRLGGTGTRDGAFDAPSGIDPTNGLVLVVADAGNNRIQRFSREFRHLETLPVPRVGALEHDRSRPSYRTTDPTLAAAAEGRPVSVGISTAGETFAVDADGGVVLKWDAGRRLTRVIGGFDEGRGQLADPVDLALTDDHLYVADAGRDAVLLYDHFGGFIRSLAEGRAVDVRAVTVVGDETWIILPGEVLVYTASGRLTRELIVVGPDVRPLDLVDAALAGNHVYTVTSEGLWRVGMSN